MVRLSRHVAVNVELLAKCGELDTKLSVVLRPAHVFRGLNIQERERAAGLDRRQFDEASASLM